MNEEEYGDKFKEHLLEQYKLYVEMADNVSSRRAQTNMFYISVLSGLLAILSISNKGDIQGTAQTIITLTVALLGSLLCIVWWVNIKSYRQLNSGKFKVIHEIEQDLPFACYDREWELLRGGKENDKYLQLTRIEQYVPAMLAIPYMIIFFYSLYMLFKCCV